jgi:hypothetical protein
MWRVLLGRPEARSRDFPARGLTAIIPAALDRTAAKAAVSLWASPPGPPSSSATAHNASATSPAGASRATCSPHGSRGSRRRGSPTDGSCLDPTARWSTSSPSTARSWRRSFYDSGAGGPLAQRSPGRRGPDPGRAARCAPGGVPARGGAKGRSELRAAPRRGDDPRSRRRRAARGRRRACARAGSRDRGRAGAPPADLRRGGRGGGRRGRARDRGRYFRPRAVRGVLPPVAAGRGAGLRLSRELRGPPSRPRSLRPGRSRAPRRAGS